MRKTNYYIFYLFLIFFLLLKIEFLANYPTSSDLLNFMYHGQQLINGRLVWIYEFEDKLPINQFLFLIPAYFKNLYAWYFVSIFFLALSTLFVFIFSKRYLKGIKNEKYIFQFSILTSLIYLALNLSFYDSIKHINTIAINSFVIGFSLLTVELDKTKKWRIIAILFMGIAVSVRPYFLVPIIFTFLYKNLIGLNYFRIKKDFFISLFIDFSIFGTSIIFLNFIFYWDQPNTVFAAFEAIRGMGSKINFLENLKIHIYNILFSSIEHAIIFTVTAVYAITHIINIRLYDYKAKLFIVFFILLSPIFLFYTITIREIHIHYVIFYIPFVLFVLIFNLKYFVNNNQSLYKFLSTIFLILIICNFVSPYPREETMLPQEESAIPQEENIIPRDFVFFAPFNISLHYDFNQHRFGFPNVEITEMIFKEEYISTFPRIKSKKNFKFPTSSKEYCKLLNDSKINNIIITGKREMSLFNKCLSIITNYYEDKIDNLTIFIKKQ